MEILQWKTNSDLIRLAKELLENTEEPYQYSYDKEKDTCLYRMPDNPEVRCIVGRLFYGHIPEDNAFWESPLAIEEAWDTYDLGDLFPDISVSLLKRLQPRHDEAAWGGNPNKASMATWADLEAMAAEADKKC